jgi:aconitate decarboxylase
MQGVPDSALAIGRHLAATRFEDLPAATVAATKASILDTIGCAIAGGSGPDIAAIRAVVGAWGGAPACTVVDDVGWHGEGS